MNKLSDKKEDVSFDLIPLPSKGKIYNGIGQKVKVSYMDASDEGILTSPNILQSPEFLQILIDRNLIEPNLNYSDLHEADLYAIMIWLRATAFGTEYPVTVYTKKGNSFDFVYDLTSIKYRDFKLNPDADGLFEFKSSDNLIYKFKFLSLGDADEINSQVEKEKVENGDSFVDRTPELTLGRMIKSINGNSDVDYITNHIKKMRLLHIREFRKFITDNEPFVDTKIDIVTDLGEAVSTFLPVNIRFFWPDIQLS